MNWYVIMGLYSKSHHCLINWRIFSDFPSFEYSKLRQPLCLYHSIFGANFSIQVMLFLYICLLLVKIGDLWKIEWYLRMHNRANENLFENLFIWNNVLVLWHHTSSNISNDYWKYHCVSFKNQRRKFLHKNKTPKQLKWEYGILTALEYTKLWLLTFENTGMSYFDQEKLCAIKVIV